MITGIVMPNYVVNSLVGNGDKIGIITFRKNQLTCDFEVGDEGNIALARRGVQETCADHADG